MHTASVSHAKYSFVAKFIGHRDYKGNNYENALFELNGAMLTVVWQIHPILK
jgi:hypothetical protein